MSLDNAISSILSTILKLYADKLFRVNDLSLRHFSMLQANYDSEMRNSPTFFETTTSQGACNFH